MRYKKQKTFDLVKNVSKPKAFYPRKNF